MTPNIDQEALNIIRKLMRSYRVTIVIMWITIIVFAIFDAGMITRFVGMFVALGIWVLPAFRRKAKKKLKVQRGDPWCLPLRANIEMYASIMLCMVSMQLIVQTRNGISDGIPWVGMYLGMAGVGFLVLSRHARQPGQISCEHCSYELVGLTLPCMCPECGRALNDISYTTDRPRVKSPWFVWGGVALSLLGGFIYITALLKPAFIYAPVPRSILLSMAATDRDAFARLDMTKLTPTEEQQLADRMVSQLAGKEWYAQSYDQDQWITDRAFTGGLTQTQLDAILFPATELWVDAPTQARVGEQIELRLGIKNTSLPSFALTPYYYIEGFVIGENSTPIGGSTSARYGLDLTKEYRDDPKTKGAPLEYWTPAQPGEIVVQARVVWAIFANAGRSQTQIVWDEDHQWSFPTPPIWSRVIDLHHTIEVLP